MAASTIAQNGQTVEQPKGKANKASKPTTKDPKRCNWSENSANQLLSGIEFRDAESNKLVHFITIQHQEILKESTPFRMTVPVNEDGTFDLPRKQTFEEMIQAKRRQQNALFAAGQHQTNTSSNLTNRAARRVSAAARRRSAAVSNLSATNRTTTHRLIQDKRPEPEIRKESEKSSVTARPKKKKSSKQSSSRSKSKKDSKVTTLESTPELPAERLTQPSTSTTPVASTSAPTPPAPASTSTVDVEASHSKSSISEPLEVKTLAHDMASTGKPIHLISSIKELHRQDASLGMIDKKEIKRLLKSAPPGAALVLSNGTVIKKSNRGGARAGAGRKRSRPITNGSQPVGSLPSSQQQDSRSSLTNMSTSSDQTVISGTANTSESNITLNP